MERYRKIYFLGIPRCPNKIPKNLRNMVSKFLGITTIIGEQHLRDFSNF